MRLPQCLFYWLCRASVNCCMPFNRYFLLVLSALFALCTQPQAKEATREKAVASAVAQPASAPRDDDRDRARVDALRERQRTRDLRYEKFKRIDSFSSR